MKASGKSKSTSDDDRILALLREEEYVPTPENDKTIIHKIMSRRTDEENIALASATAKGHNPKEYKLKQKIKSYKKKKERDGFFEKLQKL